MPFQYRIYSIIAVILYFAYLPASCSKKAAPDVQITTKSVTDDAGYGLFLEKMPEFPALPDEFFRIIHPEKTRKYKAEYKRIITDVIYDPHSVRKSTFFASALHNGAAFTYSCKGLKQSFFRAMIYTGHGYKPDTRLELKFGGDSVEIPLPAGARRLVTFKVPVFNDFCESGERDTVRIALKTKDPGSKGIRNSRLLLSPLQLVSRTEKPSPVVILISLDTMRRDFWDQGVQRPGSLIKLYNDSVKFRHAYSSFPSTPQSFSVIFSGLRPENAVKKTPLKEGRSFVPFLRNKGFNTVGFVAGGYVRANFGFSRKLPGFSLGFDLYVEEEPMPVRWKRSGGRLSYMKKRYISVHTLGPALERSLRWLSKSGNEPSFNFIHCYDVHEHTFVSRSYFDRMFRLLSDSGISGTEIVRCARAAGLVFTNDSGVYFPANIVQLGKMAVSSKERLPCYRMLTNLMYRARILSMEETFSRYLDALKQLDIYDRALIIVTSDHGESLLDETQWDNEPVLGHNRLLANNLEVPLWIKLPGPGKMTGMEDRLAGLIDLRATIGEILGMDLGESEGIDLMNPDSKRKGLLKFSNLGGAHGFVMPGFDLCAWKPVKVDGKKKMLHRVFSDGSWEFRDEQEETECTLAAEKNSFDRTTIRAEPIPEELKEELRALGYMQ